MTKHRPGDERREQIALAALEIAGAKGFNALSMAAVAQRTGLVPSAIYRHFDSKEQMLIAAIELLPTLRLRRLAEIAVREPSPLKLLWALLSDMEQFVPKAIAIPRVIFGLLEDASPAVRRALRRLVDRVQGEIAALIELAQEAGEVDPSVDPRAAAMLVWGMLITLTMRWYISGGQYDVAANAPRIWQLFLNGIRPQARVPLDADGGLTGANREVQ